MRQTQEQKAREELLRYTREHRNELDLKWTRAELPARGALFRLLDWLDAVNAEPAPSAGSDEP